jgi:hypothetical protein
MDTPSDAMDARNRNALNERRDGRHIPNKRAARKPDPSGYPPKLGS